MFSKFAYISLVTLSFFTTIGLSAPVGNGTSLDAATLLKNGQAAQAQNAVFQTLKANDPCTTGDAACVNSAQAECVGGKWTLTRCSRTTRCFAVPSIKEEGTTLTCTSERSALSLIEASGAQGGIAVAQPNGSSPSGNATASDTGVGAGSPRTVTVTVAPPSSSTASSSSPPPSNILSTDLPAQTLTVPAAEASAVLSSLTASGSFSIVSVIQPSGAAAAFPVDASQGAGEKPAATTIKLTAAALPSQTSVTQNASGSAANLNVPGSAPTSAASGGSSGYGY